MFPAGFEPATFRVWGERDNRYTTETVDIVLSIFVDWTNILFWYFLT